MTRILSCCFAWFVLAIGIAEAVPAQPLYEPPAPVQAPAVAISSLSGTAWLAPVAKGKGNRVFIFEPDGTLSYKASITTPTIYKDRGSWKVEGSTVYFGYSLKGGAPTFEFRGVIKDADTIVGESLSTKAGVKNPLTLQRTTLEMK